MHIMINWHVLGFGIGVGKFARKKVDFAYKMIGVVVIEFFLSKLKKARRFEAFVVIVFMPFDRIVT